MFGRLFCTGYSRSRYTKRINLLPVYFQRNFRTNSVPKLVVCGVGGAGGNALNHMVIKKVTGTDFLSCNTDNQALSQQLVRNRVHLGKVLTKGQGTGAKPKLGAQAAMESLDEIMSRLVHCDMVFIVAGLGGGTGTGASPIIAKALKEKGVLTVAVVTTPFSFEGGTRRAIARDGYVKLRPEVDSILLIPNENLLRANRDSSLMDAFSHSNEVISSGIKTVSQILGESGTINVDFGDIKAIMTNSGHAMFGTGEAEGEDRALRAADLALQSQLVNVSLKGAKGLIINVSGGDDLSLTEVNEVCNFIKQEADPDVNLIFGSAFVENFEGKIRVSIIATGLEDLDRIY